jgi:O-6-methylguanine DNA methyltransferase
VAEEAPERDAAGQAAGSDRRLVRELRLATAPTPIGSLELWIDEEDRPLWLDLPGASAERSRPGPAALARIGACRLRPADLPSRWRDWLGGYFETRIWSWPADLSLAGSAFEERVWNELPGLPLGHTLSYGELARRCGYPRAPRAVAAAVGRNPLPLLCPCHRIVGARGLGGYRLGLSTKAWLLAHEGAVAAGR